MLALSFVDIFRGRDRVAYQNMARNLLFGTEALCGFRLHGISKSGSKC